ncbi:serine O-acetyltransferase [Algoriphagus zhangzhouensis]|uniref:Serine acetyltransferase n=1 Tax=Algoriphagus zhangzhouensis TaxID=1073327 RepID=A0A1M7Z3L8_9BACT|nr:hypothetical protein [Algoriphagus zhangzhouensis]TDY48368.1 serine O-acetyltransferase [Algoriphagus zhangzhouensis]SHO59415.1 serine O-acetyltransferase [Algoriphagus zhangzhouensis]
MKEIICNIKSDLFRVTGQCGFFSFLKCLYSSPGFKFLFYFRLSQRYSRITPFGFFSYLFYKHCSIKYGFQIPLSVSLGKGLAFPHFGNIVINSKVSIGDNCNILHGVTLGNVKYGKNVGSPRIGNNVFIGPGSVIIGGINVGNNTLIVANSFVNVNVPDNCIAIGNPCKIISSSISANVHMINNLSDFKQC